MNGFSGLTRSRLATAAIWALVVAAIAAPVAFAGEPSGSGTDEDAANGQGHRSDAPSVYTMQGDVTNPLGTDWTYLRSNAGGFRFDYDGTGISNALIGYIDAGGSGAGVSGFSSSANGRGVIGRHVASTGTEPGVQGETDSTASSANAIYGVVNPTSPGGFSAAVRGQNNGTGGLGIGVYGSQAGTGWGVYGTSAGGRGVLGSGGIGGTGVYGFASGANSEGVYGSGATGVSGVCAVASCYGVAGVASGSNAYGIVGSAPAANGTALLGTANGAGATGFYGYSALARGGIMESGNNIGLQAFNHNNASYALVTGAGGTNYGHTLIQGNFAVATGFTKSGRVATNQGERLMYAEESTMNIYTDQGSASLVNGRAVIQIDPLYAQTANLEKPYQVFLTPGSASSLGLAVVNKTSTSFEVRELGNGQGNFTFDWKIEGLRRGFEGVRMAPAPALPSNDLPSRELPRALPIPPDAELPPEQQDPDK